MKARDERITYLETENAMLYLRLAQVRDPNIYIFLMISFTIFYNSAIIWAKVFQMHFVYLALHLHITS